MNRKELRAQARDWLDDHVVPGLWPDKTLNRYADEAVREAVIRARLLVDSSSTITQIPVVPGRASYTLAPEIIFARRVGYFDATRQYEHALHRITYDMLDNRREYSIRSCGNGNWTTWQTPVPHYVVQDLEQRTLRLVGIPTGQGTLKLTVVRWPLDCEVMQTDTDSPCIDQQWHLPLAHWICYRAYLHKDAELYDKQESDKHYAQFEATFGTRPTVKEIRSMAHDRAGEITPYEF